MKTRWHNDPPRSPAEQRAIKAGKFLQRDQADSRMRNAVEQWVAGGSTAEHDATRADEKQRIRNARKPVRDWD